MIYMKKLKIPLGFIYTGIQTCIYDYGCCSSQTIWSTTYYWWVWTQETSQIPSPQIRQQRNLCCQRQQHQVQSCIPHYFKLKSTPCISHRYTSTIASKLFDYKQTLQCLDIEQLRQNPPNCSYASPFNYSPAGHVIIGGCKYCTKRGSKVPDMERPQIPRTLLF
jgi:hypothetical protein